MIKSGIDRDQIQIFTSPEEMINGNNIVRYIDLIVSHIISQHPDEFNYKKGKSLEGRPAYPFEALLKLYIYGYIYRIKSSRCLERECYRNIEVIWLLNSLKPDHKTISDFRQVYEKEIKTFNTLFRRQIKELGFISNEFAIDGSKIKANANKDMETRSSLIQRLADMDKLINEYYAEINKTDENEKSSELEIQNYRSQITSLESEVQHLQTIISEMAASGKNHYSHTDSTCNLVKSRDGIVPGYNFQIAVDTRDGFIASDYVTDAANDINEIEKVVELTREEMGYDKINAILDCGYANLDLIEQLETSDKANCYVGMPREQRSSEFTYDPSTDSYICPQNKRLTRIEIKKKRQHSHVIRYQCFDCADCKLRSVCTTSSRGRLTSRNSNQDYRDNFRKKMESPLGHLMMRVRRCTVECVFGTLKIMGGKIPILTRGIKKVATELKLYVISYNLNHLSKKLSYADLASFLH